MQLSVLPFGGHSASRVTLTIILATIALLSLAHGQNTKLTGAEDVLLLSSWKTMRYWSTNTSLHSSKELQDLSRSAAGSITGVELFVTDKCRNVLVWCDTDSQTLYSSRLQTNDRNLSSREAVKLLQMNFGSRVRIAVDSVKNQIYLSLYDFNRIDVFDVETKTLITIFSNISHPNDIAFDSRANVLSWVENWSCVGHMAFNDSRPVKLCSNDSTQVRALATDPTNGLLFWSDSNGNIYEQTYLEESAKLIFSSHKMVRNLALDVTANAIYLSNEFMLMAIDRQSLRGTIVLIESSAILDMTAIESKDLCYEPEVEPTDNYLDYSLINETSVAPNVIIPSPINTSLTIDSNSEVIRSDNSEEVSSFSSKHLITICLAVILIVSVLILTAIKTFKYFANRSQSQRQNAVRRLSGRRGNRLLISDRRKLIAASNAGPIVQIEDLGSFGNNFCDPSVSANRALRQACNACEDREECLERGVCLTTYKLLT